MEGPRVGFIGLGLMGGAMTRRLLSKGFSVQGYDVDPAKVAAVVELGARGADSAAEVAASADVLCTSLPNGDILRDVYLGSGEVL
ncbi:MAG: NAD(P)-binding domain-containing protein, partial [Chloroflexota bacterium]